MGEASLNKKAQAAALWIIIAVIIIVALIVIAYYYPPLGNMGINNTSGQNCTNLYFFDTNNLTGNATCVYTQFCGAYMYPGLMAFTNLSDCQASLANFTGGMNTTINTTNQTGNTTNTTSNTTVIPATYSVAIEDFSFTPQTLTINAGDTVTWTNNGPSQHTVASNSGAELDSAVLAVGNTYTHTFITAGTFQYHCSIHPTLMTGTINVLGNETV
jgi:plastocyanin